MQRKEDSHKGQNGKVMVIGGNAMFHGAPILCSLGAEYSGVDLVFPFMPPCHAQVARTYSLNLIIQTFEKDHLISADVKRILDFSEKADVVVIGPGLGEAKETQKAVKELLSKLEKPTVVDADALIYTNTLPKTTVLTPHREEFKEMTKDEPTPENVQKWAKHLKATIIVKGPEDIIADKEDLMINKTGNALMTVGGTGDVLSGLIAGLMAQGNAPVDACHIAAHTLGEAADHLSEKQANLRASELVQLIPRLLYKND
ncbi:NAD(P)H-hydrate dehydratase [Patescibacteria group bacterium]|nr:NAD(P)H-hydrate dehydratase [Patescibacteria group bacterium]